MIEKIKRYTKYKILRYRVKQFGIKELTKRELKLLDFVKTTLRNSDSIIITADIIKVAKKTINMTFEDGRLIVVDEKSIMDIKVGEPIKRLMMEYANKVIRYRNAIFTKCCDQQISNLIDGFQN